MPTHRVVRYIDGPLDGLTLDATDWTDEQLHAGAYQIVDGWEDRAAYEPDPAPDSDPTLWRYRGPVPD